MARTADLLPPLSHAQPTQGGVSRARGAPNRTEANHPEEFGLALGRHRWHQSRRWSCGDACLMVSLGGPLEGRLGDQVLRLGGPQAALFLPDRWAGEIALREFDGLLLRLQSSRLERAAASMIGQQWSPRRFAPLLQQPITVAGSAGSAQRHLLRLGVIARLLDPMAGHPPEEIRLLALEDVLDRLVVLSLWEERLCAEFASPGVAGGDRQAILDDLVAWIRANSHRPLHLAELEKRSGYSERSLRNAFQDRFGCAPKQWIRRTRMESARQRLLDARPEETVSTIAREHGYQHISQFSRDFRCVFGEQPSLVMRQGRRALG